MMRHVRRTVPVLVIVVALLVGAYTLMNSTTFQFFGGLTDRVGTSHKVVALTFDDGPTCADVDAILAALGDVRATFFIIGSQAQACPDGLKRLVAAGHEIGNHTWDHRRMVFVSPEAVTAQIEPTDQVIRAAGYSGEILVRPPYGKKLLVFPWWLHANDRRTIMWDVAVEDASGGPASAAEDIAARTVKAVAPGSIILLHPWNGRAQTQRAIGAVIAQLRAQGYTLGTVSDLLAARP